MKNTLKSVKGVHIVTVNGKPMVCATIIEAIKCIGEVSK